MGVRLRSIQNHGKQRIHNYLQKYSLKEIQIEDIRVAGFSLNQSDWRLRKQS